MARQPRIYYEFGPFRLDSAERLLFRGSEVVPLTPKLFDVLFVLVQNSGHILGKEEMMKVVWPDSAVEEGNLTRNVSSLRKALGENSEQTRYIETIPWRGYRFAATVREISETENDLIVEERSKSRVIIEEYEATNSAAKLVDRLIQNNPRVLTALVRDRWRWRTVTAVLAAATALAIAGTYLWRSSSPHPVEAGPTIKSIAVLPFKPISQEGRDEYLELGMADTLITKLTSLKQVIVRPTGAVRKYTGLDQDPIAAGRELKVEAVLDGSITRLGDRLRVTVRLLNTQDGSPLWAYKCDGYCPDIFTAQDSIAERVAGALALKLSGEEQKLLTKHYTENPQAYQLYMTGRYFWNKRTAEGLEKGIEYFQQAIDRDPTYALAYSGIAQSYIPLGRYGYMSPNEARARASAAARKALDMDDTLAEAHSVMGVVQGWSWNWAEADYEHKRAVEISPAYAPARQWYSEYLLDVGRRDEAFAELRIAQELDPTSLVINSWAGFGYYYDRQYDRAVEQSQRVSELDPNFVTLHWFLGLTDIERNKLDDANTELRKAVDLSRGAAQIRSDLAYAYAVSGRKSEARALLHEITDLARSQGGFAYDVAVIYLGLGEKEQALTWLEKAYDERSILFQKLKVDPRLDQLRSDAQFRDLLRRVNLEP